VVQLFQGCKATRREIRQLGIDCTTLGGSITGGGLPPVNSVSLLNFCESHCGGKLQTIKLKCNNEHMKVISILGCVLLILISAGCYSTDPNGDQPIRYASSVQIPPYDSIVRNPSQNIEIFQDVSEVKRPHQIIALLTREAYPRDEALITGALIWRGQTHWCQRNHSPPRQL